MSANIRFAFATELRSDRCCKAVLEHLQSIMSAPTVPPEPVNPGNGQHEGRYRSCSVGRMRRHAILSACIAGVLVAHSGGLDAAAHVTRARRLEAIRHADPNPTNRYTGKVKIERLVVS